MLRRRLLISFAPLVLLLLAVAVAAIVLLQRSLTRLDHIDTIGWVAVEKVAVLATLGGRAEATLHELTAYDADRSAAARAVDELDAVTAELQAVVADPDPCCDGGAEAICNDVRAGVLELARGTARIRRDLASGDPKPAVQATLARVASLRVRLADLTDAVREHVKAEQAGVLQSFRRTVVVLTAFFLLLINAAVGLLLWTAGMVVRPVERLVAATRALGEGHFEHRVELPRPAGGADEFGELAEAVNRLAGRLEAGERRQMETLGQVALAMNHELNNTISIIELQLSLLARRTAASPELEKCLTQIHGSLGRMTSAVAGLKNVRRIVLTDYLPGMKMLDLARSQLPEPADASRSPSPPGSPPGRDESDLALPRV